jgi:hypothetical protein
MLLFAKWLENTDISVVSFDFDGVLHKDVDENGHIINFYTSNLTPYLKMHEVLINEAKSNKVILVSARNKDGRMDKVAIDFCNRYSLPISEFFFTWSTKAKPGVLKEQKVVRHYDDSLILKGLLAGSEIEFIYVNPRG